MVSKYNYIFFWVVRFIIIKNFSSFFNTSLFINYSNILLMSNTIFFCIRFYLFIYRTTIVFTTKVLCYNCRFELHLSHYDCALTPFYNALFVVWTMSSSFKDVPASSLWGCSFTYYASSSWHVNFLI